jgi:transposase
MQGHHIPRQKVFTSFTLADKVPPHNIYRQLQEQLNLDFLYSRTLLYYGKEGNPSIDPIVFFKLILVGYIENLNSDRSIIEHASMRMDILYYLGYDIDEELPWHSTLSRTRQLYGEEVFLELFRSVLHLCVSKGMVRGKRQALDSAHIKANASMDSLIEKEILNDGDAYARELAQTDDTKVLASIKKQVEKHHAWKKKEYSKQPGATQREYTDEHGNLIRPKFVSNHTHYSTTDAEARISVKPGKPRQLTYTAQTVVDTAHHVITAIGVSSSDKRDSQCLAEITSIARNNLHAEDIEIEELLADAGYSSGESYKYLEEQGIIGYIPTFGQYKPEREGFIYNKEDDSYLCQRGNKAVLVCKGARTDSKGYTKKTYRSSETVCKNCPLRKECCGKKTKFKKLDDSIDKPYYDRMHQRLQTKKAKCMAQVRSSTVEPVLGTLINFGGMRRIWTRGKEQANKIMLAAATAYNLKKWLKFSRTKAEAVVKCAEVPTNSTITAVHAPLFAFLRALSTILYHTTTTVLQRTIQPTLKYP